MAGPLANRSSIPLRRAVPELPMHPRTVTPSLQKAEFRRDSLGRAPRFDVS